MELLPANKKQMAQVKCLYLSAFPKEERQPFRMLKRLCRKGKGEILVIEEQGFCGMAVVLQHKDMALLLYFAVSPDKRGLGIGSQALRLLKERYNGKRFLLEIESTKGSAENQEERIRRLHFYQQNGLTATPLMITLFGVEMELLTDGSPLSFQDYYALYRQYLGKYLTKYGVKYLKG